MPALSGATEWLNSSSSVDHLHGCETIVYFWAISCPMCRMSIPRLHRLLRDYAAHNLHLIAVHMPRTEADMDVAKVKKVVEEMHMIGPCAIDNTHVIGDRFQTGGSWPSYFLFDAKGRLRSRAAGALGLKMAENSLKRLLCSEPIGPVSADALAPD